MREFNFIFMFFLLFSCNENEIIDNSIFSENEDLNKIIKDSKIHSENNDTLIDNRKYKVDIIAHMGASAYEPENSIRSFLRAFEQNADGIELDLWFSSNDSIIVFHDQNTKRVTGKDYDIPTTHSDVLRELNIGKGEKIPFLNEVFKILPSGKKIYLDIKWHGGGQVDSRKIDLFMNQLIRNNRLKDCYIISFHIIHLDAIKRKYPNAFVCWLNQNTITNEMIFRNLAQWNVDGLASHYEIINKEMMSFVKTKRMKYKTWTLNDRDIALELYQKYQIDAIITDRPDIIKSKFEEFYN